MDVVYRRHEADDLAVIDSHNQMVARICQKLIAPTHIDRIVKDIRRNVGKYPSVLRVQDLDFDHARILPAAARLREGEISQAGFRSRVAARHGKIGGTVLTTVARGERPKLKTIAGERSGMGVNRIMPARTAARESLDRRLYLTCEPRYFYIVHL